MKKKYQLSLTETELRNLAMFLATEGVRNNTELEDLHSGTSPLSKTGDYSDVKVVSPYGEIPWNELSRFNDKEMRALMLSIERALLLALKAYENLDNDLRQGIPTFLKSRRSYDIKQ